MFPLHSRPWVLSPLVLHPARAGLENRVCECWWPVAVTDYLRYKTQGLCSAFPPAPEAWTYAYNFFAKMLS